VSKRTRVTDYLLSLQDRICSGLEAADDKGKFMEDAWQHTTGGGGRSRIMAHGNVFEKGGVNFSAVEGSIPGFLKEKVSAGSETFFATGVSLVLHPYSPLVPITHMNIRYFETNAGDSWFGGGIDLTPIYVNEDDAVQFHRVLKDACHHLAPDAYDRYREWADDYFFNRHRNETRGIGGIFFDYLRPDDFCNWEKLFSFMQEVGNAFLPSYVPLVEKHKQESFTPQQKEWQLIRRGRYVEFNLVYDRGTRFGLETGGRIESILMSLPEYASWKYDHRPAVDSPEYRTLQWLRKGVDWLSADV
jgi:coproporphyrinogen III oxidase